MKWFILLLAMAGKSLHVDAQTVSVNMPEQDCYGAIRICQTSYSNTNSYTGSGSIPNEINPAYSCLSTGEKNDVWYSFTTHSAGFISFTITPFNIHDDYDWAVFNITNSSCSNIFSDSSLEVSCNYDANVGCNGVTGANSNFTSCGQTEAVIPVMNGETYMINVSNYSSSQSGYTIDFSSSTAQIFDNTPPLVFADTISCGQTLLNIYFDEHIDCNSLTPNGTDLFLMDSTGNVITPSGIVISGCDSVHPYITSAQLVLPQPLGDHTTYFLIAKSGSDGNTLSDVCGNFIAAGDTVSIVHVVNTLSVSLGSDVLICKNEVMPALHAQLCGSPTLEWFLSNTLIASSTQQIIPADTGEYILNVSYGLQCKTQDTLHITYKPELIFSLGNDTTVCKQNEIPVLSSGIANADSYTWYLNGLFVGSNTNSYQPISGGAIVLTIEKNNYCAASDTMVLTVVNIPEINLGDDKKICEGSTIDLNASLNLEGNYQWFKNDIDIGNNSSTLPVMSQGNYKIIFTGNAGCTSSDSITISTTTTPSAPKISCPEIKTSGKEFSWEAVNNVTGYEISDDNGTSWTAVSNQTLSYLAPGEVTTLKLRAINDGCNSPIAESPSCEEYITTVLLPNFNSFEISGIENPLQLYVFDAMGKQVLFDVDYKNNWSGSSLKNGVYFYTIRYAKAKYRSGKFLVQR